MSLRKIMDPILRRCAPITLHAIVQRTKVLTIQDLTLMYIKQSTFHV